MRKIKTTRDERGSVWVAVMALFLAVGVLLILIGVAGETGSNTKETVSVTGSANVNVVPSMVSFNVGVSENSGSATGALNAMEAAAAKVNAALKNAGVKAKNIQSDGVSVNPVTNSNGVITGFNASEDVVVNVGTKLAGVALDAGARAGGNGADLSGISWSVGAGNPGYAKARAEAVGSARRAAAEIAAKLGVGLGSVKSVVDEGSSSNVIAPVGFASSVGRTVPIEAGTSVVSDSVKVVFYLK
jgi:hypothetical protein